MFLSPAGPVIGVKTTLPAIPAAAILLQNIGPLTEVRKIFAQVPAALGDERAEVEHHLPTHGIAFIHLALAALDHLAKPGVEILPLVLELREPREVINARVPPGHLLIVDAQRPRELGEREERGVTQSDHVRLGHCASRGETHDAHGVGVVEHDRVGAQLHRIAEDVEPDGHRPHRLEQPAGADGVADALVDAELQRDVVVVADAPGPAHVDGVNQIIGARHDFAAVAGHRHRPTVRFSVMVDESLDDLSHRLHAIDIEVDQRDLAAVRTGDREDVVHQRMREVTGGPDHGDLDGPMKPPRQPLVM